MEVRVPRYFIDTTDGSFHAIDEEGLELANLEAARHEAVCALPEIARGRIDNGVHKSVVVKVRDEEGAVLYQAALTLTEEWMVAP